MSKSRRFTRQIIDPNGDCVSTNERCSVSIIEGRAVVLRDGLRIIGYYTKWPEPDQLEFIRNEFIRMMWDPREPDADWAVLNA